MARIASFLPRNDFRTYARAAYRFALTAARTTGTFSRNGIEYTTSVDFELNAVFIDWTDPEFGDKATSFEIAKAWGY